ncbi:MAG: hypothetical protein OHK0013_41080 [Sandaracinaceae bacterium]
MSDSGKRGATRAHEDVILPHARTEDGRGVHVLRKRGDTVEAGVLRALEEGRPIHGELVRLERRPGTPLFDVHVELDARPPSAEKRGRPPKVATRAFRAGWDEIWGRGRATDEEPS